MIFQCHDLERALGSPDLMPDARAHAETCAQCRRQLYLWTEISRLAPQLHQEWESPELWPRIAADLAAAAPAPRRSWGWRGGVAGWTLAAAAVSLLALLLAHPWSGRRTASADFLTEEALRDVQQTEAAYARSIERLSEVSRASLQQSPSPVAAAYREKLALLDSAIGDLKATLEGNRYNVYLQTQLASLYQEKQKTLQEWVQNAKRN